MDTGNLFSAFRVSAEGLGAQRARLNVISANIANAQTTRTAEGGPYRRRVVRIVGTESGPFPQLLDRLLGAEQDPELALEQTSARHIALPAGFRLGRRGGGLLYTVEIDHDSPTRLEYDPGHPDANEEGYVEYPNVDIVREMVELLAASRAYEANVTVLNAAKAMLRKALEI